MQPRNCAAHGLFGSKYLKRHNLRDNRWTVNDLIEQYERLSNIYRKNNEVKNHQREHDEMNEADLYRKLKKEFKDKIELLQIVLRGDVQRTKNILINYPNYMRTYQNKQSYEVLEELDAQTFQTRKKLDRYIGERQRLMNEYETFLMDVAQKQETIRYYDIKEFQQERDTKRLYVELKNSQTRWRAIQNINLTYKNVIDQLLHDSLYYQPVIETLNNDWKEQARFMQETFNIGFPTIKQVKNIERQVKTLEKKTRKDEEKRNNDLFQNKLALRQHPKKVKELVRRDSDFTGLNDRYTRETESMAELRLEVQNTKKTITELMNTTLAKTPDDIATRISSTLKSISKWREEVVRVRVRHKAAEVQMSFYKSIQKIMLNDHPDLYKDELLDKSTQLQRAIFNIKEKIENYKEQITDLIHFEKTLNHSIVHILDVIRHVDPVNIFAEPQYPETLQPPLLQFNDLPEVPLQIEVNVPKVLAMIKAKIHSIMQYYGKKEHEEKEIDEQIPRFQQAVIEDYFQSVRPRIDSWEFD
ncbi:hypothetical protein PVAND_010883 [Polypedilum vanderplanki]|uniref:Uncharacterized protein n=1 Tax=Polypedilum vanderplanki TaxID=319348 RepID=A0A9J6CHU7_POLVA|nr:hypothetical protein PVAND_010883 [Polypedilum vanderplanki]